MAVERAQRTILCYHCGHAQEVSARAMSLPCSACHRALKVEDLDVKNYLPVTEVLTCGTLHVTPRGRIAARRIHAGQGAKIEGPVDGSLESHALIVMTARAVWRGESLRCPRLIIEDGAVMNGRVEMGGVGG